jgi:hypothetical protein
VPSQELLPYSSLHFAWKKKIRKSVRSYDRVTPRNFWTNNLFLESTLPHTSLMLCSCRKFIPVGMSVTELLCIGWCQSKAHRTQNVMMLRWLVDGERPLFLKLQTEWTCELFLNVYIFCIPLWIHG